MSVFRPLFAKNDELLSVFQKCSRLLPRWTTRNSRFLFLCRPSCIAPLSLLLLRETTHRSDSLGVFNRTRFLASWPSLVSSSSKSGQLGQGHNGSGAGANGCPIPMSSSGSNKWGGGQTIIHCQWQCTYNSVIRCKARRGALISGSAVYAIVELDQVI